MVRVTLFVFPKADTTGCFLWSLGVGTVCFLRTDDSRDLILMFTAPLFLPSSILISV